MLGFGPVAHTAIAAILPDGAPPAPPLLTGRVGYMTQVEIGSLVFFQGIFLDRLGGVYADPTFVQLFVLDPAGHEEEYNASNGSVARDIVGHYHASVTLNQSGAWTFKWRGVGVVNASSADMVLTVNSSILVAG